MNTGVGIQRAYQQTRHLTTNYTDRPSEFVIRLFPAR